MTEEAKLRWTLEDGDTLVFDDGEKFKLPSWTPQGIIDRLVTLPQDYLDLGNAAADTYSDARLYRTQRDQAIESFDGLIAKINAAEDADPTKITTILQADLERAINLIFRLAFALGAQPGGSLVDEIEDLGRKYGMSYRAPDYSAAELIDPGKDGKEHPALQAVYGSRRAQVGSGGHTATLKPEVDSGKVTLTEVTNGHPVVEDRVVNEYCISDDEIDADLGPETRDWLTDAN